MGVAPILASNLRLNPIRICMYNPCSCCRLTDVVAPLTRSPQVPQAAICAVTAITTAIRMSISLTPDLRIF